MRRTSGLVAALLLVTACTGGDEPAPSPSPSPEPSPSPTLSPEQQELARLALAVSTARYDTTYTFEAPATRDVGTLRIVAAPPSYRVDITNKGTSSVYIQTPQRTVSCSVTAQGRKSCFQVAGPGEEVPDIFDPGVQRLFSDAVADLAANPGDYAVGTAPPVAVKGLPGGTCFQVARLVEPVGDDPVGFETGRYCFSGRGIVVLLAVKTGRITLRKVGPPPTAALFQPLAPVATLPSLPPSPRPTPSRSTSWAAVTRRAGGGPRRRGQG